MKISARASWIGLVMAVALGAVGCGDELGDGATASDVQLAQGAINGGMLETGYPAVGGVTHPNGLCSGTLISASYVLTAAHCDSDGIAFNTGTSAANFKVRKVDARIKHPTKDLELLHLQTPIEDIAPMRFDQSANSLPLNTQCTIVGFGESYNPDGTHASGTKKSATVKVIGFNDLTIEVVKVSGQADHGDSGGPILCNGLIWGVGHTKNGEWPNEISVFYSTEEAAWIERTIGPTYFDVTLKNGWVNAGYNNRNAGAAIVQNVVHLKGAISGGSSQDAFDLPANMQPSSTVYVPVDLCNATKGRLVIQPSGAVIVQAETAFSNATCFTSLEGASFVRNTSGATNLSLVNGFVPYGYDTRPPQVTNTDGFVRLLGAIKTTGTSTTAFTLPAGFRPAKTVFVPVDMCGAHKGIMSITSAGAANLASQGDDWSYPQCFTSLESVSFPSSSATDFTPFAGINGWSVYSATVNPLGAKNVSGVVHLRGAISTASSNTNRTAFNLPIVMRPAAVVYAPVTLCGGNKGRLVISPSGDVQVDSEAGGVTNSSCLTSLEGVTYPLTDATPLVLENGWKAYASSVARPQVSLTQNIVRFKGAMSTSGNNGLAFRMPRFLAPPATTYLSVNVCGGKKGRMTIYTDGSAYVESIDGWNQAQCFVSLDGVEYVYSTTSFFTIPLINGWSNYGSGTRGAALVRTNFETVHLAGAIRTGGTNPTPFILPQVYRPSANVYLPVDLCNGAKGYLLIAANGTATVGANNAGTFGDAACFTSLEGLSFAQTTSGYSPMTLKNGWTNAIFSTRPAMARAVGDLVQLQGATANGTSAVQFTLPVEMRPALTTYVTADLCGGTRGRLIISPSGDVSVQQGGGGLSLAQCVTSLEGVWFSR